MKLLSMIDFVLKQGEIFKQDGQSQRINLICNYAKFMSYEVHPDNFNKDHQDCFFKGFDVFVYESNTEIRTIGISDFELTYNHKTKVFLNYLGDPILLTVNNLFLYCKGFGVQDQIELTDYAIKRFNLK